MRQEVERSSFENSGVDHYVQRRWELSQLPTEIFHKPGADYLEYIYGDPASGETRRAAWHRGSLINLGNNEGLIDVFDEQGDWRRELKFYYNKVTQGTAVRIQQDRHPLAFQEVHIDKNLHGRVISNCAFNAPIYVESLGKIFYLAELKIDKSDDINSLVATTAFEYKASIENMGEELDNTIAPKAFCFDLRRRKAFQICVADSRFLAIRKILAFQQTQESIANNFIDIILQTVDFSRSRKLGIRSCLNRPSTMLWLRVDDSFNTLQQTTLFSTPTILEGIPVLNVLSPMSSVLDDKIELHFFGTEHSGEHISHVAKYCVSFSRIQNSTIDRVQRVHSTEGLMFVDTEHRRTQFSTFMLRHVPNSFTLVRKEGAIGNSRCLSFAPLGENLKYEGLTLHGGILQMPELMRFTGDSVSPLQLDGLPKPHFTHLQEDYYLDRFGHDLVVKRKRVEKPTNILLWIHGGPNTMIHAGMFIPFLAFLLETVEVDLLVLPNYVGSITDSTCYDLAGHIGTLDVDTSILTLGRLVDLQNESLSLVVGGGSHGGFIAAHLLTHQKVAACIKGGILWNAVLDLNFHLAASDIPDWATYQTTGLLHQSPITLPSGVPLPAPRNKDFVLHLFEASPISKVESVSVPVCLLVGLRDLRVPPSQSLRYAELLKTPVRLHTYPDDNHAINSPKGSFHRDLQLREFLTADVGWKALQPSLHCEAIQLPLVTQAL
eukprot:Gregarina_sp_Poly_1__1903@NODE_1499_length_3992_cov_42_444586_g994_i0_p1_GENE_NODE_1499_length_3992_cov_42_444586_g994_i0NODE_1499_length_3992_cov_42_444586_g994_i0_p1_ORF_typecomplete_len718_score94_10Peptidase_S9/PF00326_21/6_5e18Hydrolase_4/PF12146_8/8_1e11Abhydrolase_3/PF07859_13/1_8e06DLH/PF01738_18/3_9e06Abhydrolase_1/PF00561_20/4_6e06BAAT_C/PF08840_11/5_6e05Abhydrolase_5/PF12695_7/0_055Abhydrolase_5/PF12695_7/3_7Abhydrolase_2/PF02230_16/1_7e03Abhydrolase_2/PF02230_16/0_023FSH1/PF03959_13/